MRIQPPKRRILVVMSDGVVIRVGSGGGGSIERDLTKKGCVYEGGGLYPLLGKDDDGAILYFLFLVTALFTAFIGQKRFCAKRIVLSCDLVGIRRDIFCVKNWHYCDLFICSMPQGVDKIQSNIHKWEYCHKCNHHRVSPSSTGEGFRHKARLSLSFSYSFSSKSLHFVGLFLSRGDPSCVSLYIVPHPPLFRR